MKTQRSADIAGGCFIAALGVLTLLAAAGIKGGMEERLPPRTLPYVVGTIILACGAILAIKSYRFRGAVTLISLALYLALMDPLGLPLSTFLYISFSVWYLGRYRIWYPLLIGVLSGGISYILFIHLLGLSFPVGPFLNR